MSKGHPAKWCVHYRSPTGNHGEKVRECAAGVPYARWDWLHFEDRPCFLREDGTSKPMAVTCEQLRRPTKAEITAYSARQKVRLLATLKALEAIAAWKKRHPHSASGSINCPICNSRLLISIARNNGHATARCQTPNCIHFMS